jgi:hypothetical protein
MIKPWIFEFLHAPAGPGEVAPEVATAVFEAGLADLSQT